MTQVLGVYLSERPTCSTLFGGRLRQVLLPTHYFPGYIIPLPHQQYIDGSEAPSIIPILTMRTSIWHLELILICFDCDDKDNSKDIYVKSLSVDCYADNTSKDIC